MIKYFYIRDYNDIEATINSWIKKNGIKKVKQVNHAITNMVAEEGHHIIIIY